MIKRSLQWSLGKELALKNTTGMGPQLIVPGGLTRPEHKQEGIPILVAWAFRLLILCSFESVNFREQDSKRMLRYFEGFANLIFTFLYSISYSNISNSFVTTSNKT
jgi:hypothetical protein